MSKHELEIIEFSVKPIGSSTVSAYYGITEIDGKAYWNCCCINGKFLGADGSEFGTFAEMLEKNVFSFFQKVRQGSEILEICQERIQIVHLNSVYL